MFPFRALGSGYGIGKAKGTCLISLADRKSRFLIARKVRAKKAESVKDAMILMLAHQPLRSITPDREKEFARHGEVMEILKVEFYFSEPYQPWQRGTNEIVFIFLTR